MSALRKFGTSLLGDDQPIGLDAQANRDLADDRLQRGTQLLKQDALDYRRARRAYRRGMRQGDARMASLGLQGMEQFDSAKELGTGIPRAEQFSLNAANNIARRDATASSMGPRPLVDRVEQPGAPETAIPRFAGGLPERPMSLGDRRQAANSLLDDFITAREANPNADIRSFVQRAESLGLGAGRSMSFEDRERLFVSAADRRLRENENQSAMRPANPQSLFARQPTMETRPDRRNLFIQKFLQAPG